MLWIQNSLQFEHSFKIQNWLENSENYNEMSVNCLNKNKPWTAIDKQIFIVFIIALIISALDWRGIKYRKLMQQKKKLQWQ